MLDVFSVLDCNVFRVFECGVLIVGLLDFEDCI